MVLVTDGYRTYLLYIYKSCGMDMKVDTVALMGFAGGGKSFIFKDSMKRDSLVNIDRNSNIGNQLTHLTYKDESVILKYFGTC